jgi:N-acetylmuramoyl-L-alanine amidase
LGRTTYSVTLPAGTLTLRAGTRAAVWTGMELHLGFAPREVEGRLLVHVLDALKNFQPLLQGSPLPPPGRRLIVVDPGHGGGNTGARSVFDGKNEKELTLDWALRLHPLLEAGGWRVLLTRTNDVEVPLGERVAFAEQSRADFFLSLHFNATPQGREQTGAETYCVTPKGIPSNLIRDFEDDFSKYYPNNAFDVQNLQYALRLHRALLSVNGHDDRGVRRARFMGVLLGQQRPAVLLEAGYLSSPAEAGRIADPAFRQRLAEAVAQALQ